MTRKWLRQLGLEAVWNVQAVDDQWRETLKEKIWLMEKERWRLGTSKNARLENYSKWKPCLTACAEQYLEERNKNRRRLWTKLRAGSLELRTKRGGGEADRSGGLEAGAAVGEALPAMLRGSGGCGARAIQVFGLCTDQVHFCSGLG